jgi:predicted phosphate transport protein (TIGR00153 family)
MFGKLMPKEGKYFDHFNDHAALISQGGQLLTELIAALANQSGEVARLADEIDAVERQADKVTHETLAQLHKSFITPFDRDEIHELISGMDDILDIIQDVAESVALYDIQRVPQEAVALAQVTARCCNHIAAVVKLLNSMQNGPHILTICHEIDDLESDADRLHRELMSRLFRDEPDVREVIKLKEIYEILESVSDRCKDVSGTIEAIVLENS